MDGWIDGWGSTAPPKLRYVGGNTRVVQYVLSLTMKEKGHTYETLHTLETFIYNIGGIDISILFLLTASLL